ncbi:MAG: nitronate monooxygenase [Marmoricola sp.]
MNWSDGKLEGLLGIDYPIVQGPFGAAGVSSVGLVAAVAEAGGLGSFGANLIAPDDLAALVTGLKVATGKPFAVNLWVPQVGEQERLSDAEWARHLEPLRPYLDELGLSDPVNSGPARPDFEAQVGALLAAAPPVMSFVMGIPRAEIIADARRRGIPTIGTATTVDEAVAIESAGMDAVVASGSDAGGHRGSFLRPIRESLVGTFSLVPQVADAVSIPVIAAGGVADGRGILAALALGADGVQIGTGFLATDESGATPVHKRALHSDRGRVTVLTRIFSGRTARAIPNRLVNELAGFEADVPGYPAQTALTLSIRRAAASRGLDEFLNLWAGQAAALTRERSAATYFHSLVSEVEAGLR